MSPPADRFHSRNPATGAVVWSGYAAGDEECESAIDQSATIQPEWERRPLEERESILRAFAVHLERARSELVRAIALETGKPGWDADWEVTAMVSKVEISIRAHRERCAAFQGDRARVWFRPHGTVAVLGPFNFPGHLPNGHIVPALLAGNTVLLKPSEYAPGVAELLLSIWRAAGLPGNVLQLLQGGPSVASRIVQDERVRGVFFTGSVPTGLLLNETLARAGKILALEMGGNNPLIVWDPSDRRRAVLAVLQSAFVTAGQRCTCARRLIVPQSPDGERLIQEIVEAARAMRVGAPLADPEPFMGPVIDEGAARRLLHAQADLVSCNATPLLPLRSLAAGTGCVSPGILDVTEVPDRPDVEIFGPLLQVIRVPDFAAALAEAGATRYGLAAGLLSASSERYRQFREQVSAGLLNWNRPLTGADSAAPFGGIRISGNYRPAAYFAADYCSYPIASIEADDLAQPDPLPPGLDECSSGQPQDRS